MAKGARRTDGESSSEDGEEPEAQDASIMEAASAAVDDAEAKAKAANELAQSKVTRLTVRIEALTTTRDALAARLGLILKPATRRGRPPGNASPGKATKPTKVKGKRTRGKGLDGEALYKILSASKGKGRGELANELGVSPTKVGPALAKLKADGRAKSKGERRAAVWFRK